MYLQCHGSNKGTGVKTKNILFYALCFLYVLYLVAISLDIARVVLHAASEVGNDISHNNTHLFFFLPLR